jgi:cytochrome P450
MLGCFTKDSTNSLEKIEVESGQGDTDGTVQGLRDIAINVLLSAGYGLSQPWGNQEAEKAPPGHTQTYIESISYLVNYYMAVAVFPAGFLSLPVMPALLRQIGSAMREFPIHTKEILEKERQSPSSSQTNLMSVLVNASDAEKLHKETDSKTKLHLSEDELTGNLYQFTIAGFDTTANALAYAVALLAVYPEWQQWIIDEADQVAMGKSDFEYEKTFPALKRCLALMFETMRLYTPIAHISRMNGPYPQPIQTSTRTYIVPPHTKMFVSACSLHLAPNIWGNDALFFRPSRWISGECFFEPPKGAYLPWSGGPRICPGLKMAQVEFLAVLFTIFKEWEVEVVRRDGETIEEARNRVKRCVDDSQSRITLQMNNPKGVVLRWRRRER